MNQTEQTKQLTYSHQNLSIDNSHMIKNTTNSDSLNADNVSQLELMFSKAVHEFRTPINAFQSSVTLLGYNISSIKSLLWSYNELSPVLKKEWEVIWKSWAKFLKTCNISCTMMTKLTDDIMDLSKMKAGVFELNTKPFELALLADEITYVFEGQWEQKGIAFMINCTDEMRSESFSADICRIKQILLNFISNAYKFTCNGSISVDMFFVSNDASSPLRPRKLGFWIKDTGVGMEPEECQNLFSLFCKGTSAKSKSKNAKGTGLGLAISKQLIEWMGGQVELESEIDKGTIISFYILEKEAHNEGKFTIIIL
jgi:signal transduction histidine kinase